MRFEWIDRPIRLPLAGAIAALLLAGGCGGNRRPDILLVTLDTTRADHLGCYGAARADTPNLDRVAAEGIVFENALCQAPVTAPSHFSMLTSLYPRSHGVMQNQDLPSGAPLLLSEFLRARGYETAAFTSVKLLSATRGFGRGFDRFDEPDRENERSRPGEETVGAALRWLDERSGRKPFFLWVHLFDAHFPYRWDEATGPPAGAPEGPFVKGGTRGEIEAAGAAGGLTDADRARLLALYASMVGYVDRAAGRLFDRLREAGRWKGTEVFVLSDHGEAFDHGSFLEHVNSIYRPTTRVVFLWKRSLGRGGGARVASPVETIDLFPTIAELEGAPPPEGLEGRSLLRLVTGAPGAPRVALVEEPPVSDRAAERIAASDEIYFANGYADEPRPPRTAGERIAATDGSWTYVFDTESGEELYDLRRDPGETTNVAGGAEGDGLDRLRHHLLQWRRGHPARERTPADAIDPETRALLEALGYL